MRIAAALLVGTACALAAGCALGVTCEIRFRLRPPARAVGRQTSWLRQAGLPASATQFWAGSTTLALVAFALVAGVTGSLFVAAVPAAAVALAPRAYFARRRTLRLREVQTAWPDGLRDILASITSGHSLGQAITALAAHGPEPLRDAFARFPSLQRMLGTVPALEVVQEELADPTSDRVIEVLVLAHERGGRLVTRILQDLVAATTRDLKVAAELESEGLETKINARVVVILPWLVLVALCAADGPFRSFYAGPAGAAVLIIGALLSALGLLLLSRLGRTRTEQRVFGGSVTGAR